MPWLPDMPIKRKLTLVILLTCTVVLLLACVALAAHEWFTYRKAMARDMTILADLLAKNTTAALAFQDETAARETLLALDAEPHVIAACLYDKAGNRFVEFVRPGVEGPFPAQPGRDGHRFEHDRLVLFRPIMLNEKRVGTIYLQADLEGLYDRLKLFSGIVGLILLGSFGLTIALSARLQRPISEPILALANTATVIAQRKDYSVRAVKQGQNEVGMLTEAFNQMLTGIEERECALRKANEALQGEITERTRAEQRLQTLNETLEQRVAERTAQLAHVNAGLQAEIAERERTQRRVDTQYVVTQILAESTKLQDATPNIVRAVCENLGWNMGAIWEADEPAQVLRCVEVWHAPSVEVGEFDAVTRQSTFARGIGLPGRVWAGGQPAWIADVAEDANFPRAPFAAKAGLRAALGFPILCGGEVLGVIEFFSHEFREPDTDLLEMFGAIGSQIGQFIERNRAEEEVRASDERTRLILARAHDAFVVMNADGAIIEWNPQAEATFGWRREEALGREMGDTIIPSKYREAHRRGLRHFLATGEGPVLNTRIEIAALHRDGHEFPVELSITPVKQGDRYIFSAFVHDITERKQAEKALRESETLYQSLVENLPLSVLRKDVAGRITFANQRYCDSLKKPLKEIIGKTAFDFYPADLARKYHEDDSRVIETGDFYEDVEQRPNLNGELRYVQVLKSPIYDSTGKALGIQILFWDVTEREVAKQALLTAKEAAEATSRAKSEFLANMSHELRTPLNSVIGFANILLKNKAANLRPEDLSFLERIVANGKHLLGLINQVLDLSKIEAKKVDLELSTVTLETIIPEILGQFEGQLRGREVKLFASLPSTPAPLFTDAARLKQVVINLIANALKFTEQGSVTVHVAVDPRTHSPLRIDVIDTGIGIPKDRQAAIFEAFQQADASTTRRYGGTGLGLTISQALCQLMGYRIEVQSEVGKGSTFSVLLGAAGVIPPRETDVPPPPRTENKPPRTEPIQVINELVELKGKLVLVIDDDFDARVLLTHLIEEAGCTVIAANSGELGLRMARELQPHLITLDLLMPEMNGWDVLKAIKADTQLRDIPVVVVSIVARENRGHILGAIEVLEKPLAREDLLAVLKRILQPERKLLIVDDDEDARRLMAAYLRDEKLETKTAGNGQEALEILETFSPDLVLLDLMMPVMDGLTFLRTIRTDPRHRHLPVVIVTAKVLSPEEASRLQAEAQSILQKAEDLETDLKKVMQELLQKTAKEQKQTTAPKTAPVVTLETIPVRRAPGVAEATPQPAPAMTQENPPCE